MRIITLCLVLLCACRSQDISSGKGSESAFRVIGYFKGKEADVDKYDLSNLTHVFFCFTYLEKNTLLLKQEDESTLIKLVSLKKKNPSLKVLISFGGWGGCETCSDIFNDEANRKTFAKSAADMIAKYEADGLDVDWESPVIGGYKKHKAAPYDKVNFTLLLRELRMAIPKSKELCFDANSFKEYIEQSVEWNEVVKYVDFINLMTYTLPSDKNNCTGHHTPLFSTASQTESVDLAVKKLFSIGIPAEKIVIGAAFYGMSYLTEDTTASGLYQPCKFKEYINYDKLHTQYLNDSNYVYRLDTMAGAAFLFNPSNKVFITFDDRTTVQMKTRYALDKKLGGIMFWRINGDIPSQGLMDAIKKEQN